MNGRASGRRLLIIDDDSDFAISTSRALALEGVNCDIAHDGAAALAALDGGETEVALLDIRLGHEDGTEVAARLRAHFPELILVIMTAYASVDSAVAALKAGAYDYLRKPFFLEELMRRWSAASSSRISGGRRHGRSTSSPCCGSSRRRRSLPRACRMTSRT